jgi:probable HAF family extracellular repeat protein
VRGSSATVTGPGTPGGTPGAGYAVNDLGQVTGWAPTASEAPRVFLCSGGTMTGLRTFGPDPAGEAINNHGVLAGRSGLGA